MHPHLSTSAHAWRCSTTIFPEYNPDHLRENVKLNSRGRSTTHSENENKNRAKSDSDANFMLFMLGETSRTIVNSRFGCGCYVVYARQGRCKNFKRRPCRCAFRPGRYARDRRFTMQCLGLQERATPIPTVKPTVLTFVFYFFSASLLVEVVLGRFLTSVGAIRCFVDPRSAMMLIWILGF